MTSELRHWQARRNEATLHRYQRSLRQFGLRPIDAPAQQPLNGLLEQLRDAAVWAWQPAHGAAIRQPAPPLVVRAGLSGRRLHLGHLGLARDVARLQRHGLPTTLFAVGSEHAASTSQLLQAITAFGGHDPVLVDVEAPRVRAFEDQALAEIPLRRLSQIYGWTPDTVLGRLRDPATMTAFLLYGPAERPAVALVDIGQAAHTALARSVAARLGRRMPLVAYRRLLPSLDGSGSRMSVHHPKSTIFMDERSDAVRRRFLGAATGGRATAAQQREHGGEPDRCPAFEVVELLCAPERAEETLRHCRSGSVLCGTCKTNHVDEVVAAVRRHRPDPAPAVTAVELPSAGGSPAVAAAVTGQSRALHRPPPREPDALERAIAGYAGVHADQVVVGNGATEVMDWVFREQAGRCPEAGSVLAGEPTFELYRDLAARHRLGYRTTPWAGPGGGHDLPGLATAMIRGTDTVVVLDTPHTVSGVPTQLSDILASLLPSLRPQARLVVDNVFSEFMAQPMRLTADLVERYDGLVVCRSLSKAHCLLGARIGYAITSAGYARQLRRHRLPYAVNSLSLAAAHAALADTGTLERTVAASRQAMAALTDCLDRLGLRYTPSDANFLLIDLGDRRDQILDVLRGRGLRFRDGGRWQLPTTIQVHVIDAAGTAALIGTLVEA